MTPDQTAVILARLDNQDRTLERIEKKADTTNGRVSKIELWKAGLEARISLLSASARISVTSFIAPIFSGVVGSVITAILFLALH